jgi:lipoprotein-anchoring transpeptidase ErfK/SrfK
MAVAADGGLDEAPAPGPAPTPTVEADAGDDGAGGLPAYVHQRMVKGFYVSTDDTVTENGVTYARTVRGRFIPDDHLALAKASTFEGVLVSERRPLPLAFVVAGTKMLARKGASGTLKEMGAVSRYEHFSVLEEQTYKGQRYVRVGAETYLPARAVAVARAATPPEDLGPDERWIDVNLTEQTLVAYEGATPVFATLVSSGRPGHETPTGSFRIYGKHVTITMDDTLAGDEAYSIEDVPWTQYFSEGYALHAAFWHDKFGRVRSHGCVNLSPSDARRLFFWTGPRIAAGLHGTAATKSNPGTRVVIHA